MAEVGLAFLSASLAVLFDRMASREVLHFIQGRKPTEVLLGKLKNAMLSVKVVLEDSEEKQLTDSSVKDWVDELKDVIYDAEDILDEIATEALQSKLQDAESPTLVGILLNSVPALLIEPFFEKVHKKIEVVLDRLEHLTKHMDCTGLHGVVGAQEKPYPEGRSTSYVSQSDTFGRDDDKKKVIDLLLSSDASGNERCVIAIVGMGGIGKTTLAQLAYNDGRVQQHFDLKIWFCVSEKFVMPNVEEAIIEAATSQPCPKFGNPEQLQVTLKKNLNGKKFLLVLDDVWSKKPKHREFLGQLLHYGTRGSKILVTTRNESVALAMKATTQHLKLLPKDDCWSLFEKHAFRDGSSNANPKIKEIGRQIVEKCKGLPLAIKAIGDLLGSESDHVERYWTTILKSNLWDVRMEETNIIPALWLSYKYLPPNLKRCFAYCSIFPKDYLFEKDELVLLWMAEGFLQQSGIETMEEVGNDCFNDLVSRSLFQQSSRSFKPRFVMHDLVNDLAKFVTGKFGFTMESDGSKEIGEMTRYLSCFGFEKNEKHLCKAKQLRTLLAINLPMGHLSSLKDLLVPADSSIGLRVLSLSKSWDKIIKSFDLSKMKYLRYLDFSSTDIDGLPDSICMLCNLQTLKLSMCIYLKKWPRDMWKLINLRHLEFETTPRLKEMPIQIGSLKCLQTLTKFVVSKHDGGSSIEELGKLINLRGNLLVQELQNVRSAKDASLKMMGYIKELVLEWNPLEEVLGISESQRDVLEDLQPHENLKCLTLVCYGGNSFPNWIGQGLPSLSELELTDCKYCSAFPPLGQLHFLNKLCIGGLDGVVTVGPEFYGNSSNSSMKPFGSLKVLELWGMSNWEDWLHSGGENEVEIFSELQELYIHNCPKLRAKLPVHPSSLAKLEIIECKKLELPMQRQYSSLEELYLRDCCDSLISFPLDLFPNLKSIQIRGCCNLQSLEQHGDDHLVISTLRILECPKFVDFPKGGLRTSNLAYFIVNNCESLRSMPDKMHRFLPSLCYLELRNCPEVESFPEGGLPSNLKQIVIIECKKLIANWKGWDLQILPSLEYLKIDIDTSEDHVESFPGGLPTSLTNFQIFSFGNLKSLDNEGFQHLTSLVELVIFNCPKLRYMPEEGFPTSLRFFHIVNCDPVLREELERKEGEEWLKVARIPNIRLDGARIHGDEVLPIWGKESPYAPPPTYDSDDGFPFE
ncbi:hypothetical protein I3842_14G007900 [Carya illinoinensis]|uniref:Disease resistance RPP13-like protein 1 n=1 Tax=Carya illinoinensis TaxID=32201 RepID=A0A922D9L4_CARIL|nr:hypothetical protein I3842_14G007900 [Carya illinoinensis]KAG6677068.1 hypothetical protein I3842_14G007900 [Carya illinoinensis]KAG6677069.1 hypothetical protein I3842_14G007900 [Carya illinoinensis]KAG6677070.1 hypothetical protein I3842_14G007900 [Carya illinoinensis]